MEPIISEGAPQAIGPYSHAVAAGGTFMFLSGQIALTPDGVLIGSNVEEQTEQIFVNIKTILQSKQLTLQNVVKTTVFLTSMADFAQMNSVYALHFASHLPARSAVEVSALPKGALVEIEVVACV
ncbi:MAG: deaminase [Ignavibacteria bacterium]|nr:deaminase [Ignavibacteria bacterium]